MAYFACSKAARTGTDSSTRASIAKGLVSPTFTDASGQKVLRGVIQADIVTGRDTGYATAQGIQERLASAARKVVGIRDTARASVSRTTPPASAPAELYSSPTGTVTTSTTLGLSKKMIAIAIAGIIALVFLVRK